MSIEITTPFPVFADVSGNPLDEGYIYIGIPGVDPIANPKNCYWDVELTELVTQPVRTKGGLPVKSPGVVGRLFISGKYSIAVRNKNSFQVFYSLEGFRSDGVGTIRARAGMDIADNELLCNVAAVSRSTYAELFSYLCKVIGTFTVTIASPGVATLVGHGLEAGDQLYLTTTGALPTGLTANTLYYAIVPTVDTLRFATSRANALAGTAINTSGTQSGVHTLTYCPWGLGDGSTTFNLPDLRETVLVGTGTRGSGVTAHDTFNIGEFKDDRGQGHVHNIASSLGPLNNATYGTGATASGTGQGGQVAVATNPLFITTQSISDGTNGAPRMGGTTRTKQAGVKWVIQFE